MVTTLGVYPLRSCTARKLVGKWDAARISRFLSGEALQAMQPVILRSVVPDQHTLAPYSDAQYLSSIRC